MTRHRKHKKNNNVLPKEEDDAFLNAIANYRSQPHNGSTRRKSISTELIDMTLGISLEDENRLRDNAMLKGFLKL